MGWALIALACSVDNDYIFDDISTHRLNQFIDECNEELVTAEHGWKFVYYPDTTQYGGFTFLMRFSAEGRCMEVRSPFNGGLPAVYAGRRPNRGMEGLCANEAGTLLYGILQSPMTGSAGYAKPDELPLCAISLAEISGCSSNKAER